MKRNKCFSFIGILLIGIVLISSYFIYKELDQDRKQDNTFQELAEVTEDNANSNESKNLMELYKLNNDIVGWVKIENTNIDYPIMQSKQNPNFYLRRNFYKKYSRYGTPYISENNDINESDVFTIYGHNMKNKKMFGTLEYYKKQSFYNDNKIIDIYKLDNEVTKDCKYEIFSVFKIALNNKNSFDYYNFNNFENEDEFLSFIDECKSLSLYETNIIPKYKDKLAILSTCEYSKNNSRLVVVAREIIK